MVTAFLLFVGFFSTLISNLTDTEKHTKVKPISKFFDWCAVISFIAILAHLFYWFIFG